ncbi:MAG: hypothetical protein ABMB14_05090 [Myxococcota bacterium]
MYLLLCTLTAAFADEPVALDALPAPVVATLARQWPTAHPVSAARDGDELEVLLADGTRQFEAILKPDGTWLETEEKVEATALPQVVQAAAQSHGRIVRAEVRTTPDGHADYEVVVRGKGKDLELHVDAAGVVKAPAEDADEEDEETEGHDGADHH